MIKIVPLKSISIFAYFAKSAKMSRVHYMLVSEIVSFPHFNVSFDVSTGFFENN